MNSCISRSLSGGVGVGSAGEATLAVRVVAPCEGEAASGGVRGSGRGPSRGVGGVLMALGEEIPRTEITDGVRMLRHFREYFDDGTPPKR